MTAAAQAFAAKSPSDPPTRAQLESLLDQSRALLNRNPAAAERLAAAMVNEARAEDATAFLALALRAQGNAFLRLGNNTRAIECLSQALQHARAVGDKSTVAQCLNSLAAAYFEANDLAAAREHWLKLSKYTHGKLADAALLRARAYTGLGAISRLLGDAGNAVRYGEQAVAERPEPHAWINLGLALHDAGKVRRAAHAFIQAVRLARKNDQIFSECFALANLAQLWIHTPSKIQWCARLIDYAMQRSATLGNNSSTLYVKEIYARYLANQQPQQAIVLSHEVLAAAITANLPHEQNNAYECLAIAYEGAGQPVEALRYYKLWKDGEIAYLKQKLRASLNTYDQLVERTSPESLSQRELQVLTQLADGLSNKAIALQLNISPYTVRQHLSSIFAKLGVNSRSEAVAMHLRMAASKDGA